MEHNIPSDRIGMIIGKVDQENVEEVRGGDAATLAAGAALIPVAPVIIPGIGLIILAGPMATAFKGITGEEDEEDMRLQQALMNAGLLEEHAREYANDIHLGRTLVAVDADDDETDTVAEILHKHGGSKLMFRRTS